MEKKAKREEFIRKLNAYRNTKYHEHIEEKNAIKRQILAIDLEGGSDD